MKRLLIIFIAGSLLCLFMPEMVFAQSDCINFCNDQCPDGDPSCVSECLAANCEAVPVTGNLWTLILMGSVFAIGSLSGGKIKSYSTLLVKKFSQIIHK